MSWKIWVLFGLCAIGGPVAVEIMDTEPSRCRSRIAVGGHCGDGLSGGGYYSGGGAGN